jgi:hypothetical protein
MQMDQPSERPGMTINERDEPKSDVTQAKTSEQENLDPRDTDHPTGSQQAAENAANDPPS